MTKRLLALLIAAGVLATPGAAVAAPPDPQGMEAVTELNDPGDMFSGRKDYSVRRGEVVLAPLGALNVDRKTIRGLVGGFRVAGDLRFARRYANCWYTVNGDENIAWCAFGETFPGNSGLTLTAPMVSAAPNARASRVKGISFRWQSKRWADARGGLRHVVDYFKEPGARVVRGTQGTLTLRKRALPMADIRAAGSSVRVSLIDSPPATASPSLTASPSATASPSRTAAAAGAADDAAGEPPALPITGPGSAVLGGALLLAGLVACSAARRRRT
jgi:hypothetical protein